MSDETELTRRRALACVGSIAVLGGCGADPGPGTIDGEGSGTPADTESGTPTGTGNVTTTDATTREGTTGDATTTGSATTERPRIETREGIVFRETPAATLRLDAALLPESSPAPAVVYVHGGAWQGGRRGVFRHWMRAMARRGYAGLTVEYRLSGEATYPAAARDVAAGVLWARSRAGDLGIDSDRIALAGSSAGGHLAALVGGAADLDVFRPRDAPTNADFGVGAVGGFSGVYDMAAEGLRSARLVEQFMGATYDERPELYREASPIEHVDGDDPPVKLLHGDADRIVPYEQATRYRDALRSGGATVDLDTAKGARHVYFYDSPWFERSVEAWRAFLDEHLS